MLTVHLYVFLNVEGSLLLYNNDNHLYYYKNQDFISLILWLYRTYELLLHVHIIYQEIFL